MSALILSGAPSGKLPDNSSSSLFASENLDSDSSLSTSWSFAFQSLFSDAVFNCSASVHQGNRQDISMAKTADSLRHFMNRSLVLLSSLICILARFDVDCHYS